MPRDERFVKYVSDGGVDSVIQSLPKVCRNCKRLRIGYRSLRYAWEIFCEQGNPLTTQSMCVDLLPKVTNVYESEHLHDRT